MMDLREVKAIECDEDEAPGGSMGSKWELDAQIPADGYILFRIIHVNIGVYDIV